MEQVVYGVKAIWF